jgi:HAD superfamily hydrolase (TIGR01490 family)
MVRPEWSAIGPGAGRRWSGPNLRSVEAAFFDLDKTVIARASMVAFGPSLYREGLISRTTVLRALYGQLVYMHLGANEDKLAKIRDSVLALSRGWDRDQVNQIVRDTLEHVVEPISYEEALEEIDRHRSEGRRIYLVSASPQEIVTPLAEHLGVDGSIATIPRVDESNRYTGEVDFYAYGPYKVDAMKALAEREGLDLAASWAYSDSYTDLPMLEAVGHPVVVNPDRVLGRLARERDWDVRTWTRTVRLKDRRRPPGGASGMAAAATVAALAGAGLWWGMRSGLLGGASRRRARSGPTPPAGAGRVSRPGRSGRPGPEASSWTRRLTPGRR